MALAVTGTAWLSRHPPALPTSHPQLEGVATPVPYKTVELKLQRPFDSNFEDVLGIPEKPDRLQRSLFQRLRAHKLRVIRAIHDCCNC